MQSTLELYADRIQKGEIRPCYPCQGQSGLIIDSSKDEIPLLILNFGLFQMQSQEIQFQTKSQEWVLIPLKGSFQVLSDGIKVEMPVSGGLFAFPTGWIDPGAVYLPCNTEVTVKGEGEIAFFHAPATEKRTPSWIESGSHHAVSRGVWAWRREVVTWITSPEISTNLVVGLTYSSPCFWSGTPPHVHDRDCPADGESDYEEIYLHLMRNSEDRSQSHPAIQLLFDQLALNQAYCVYDHTAFAIPGAAHPVIASPTSDHIYIWALAGGAGKPLQMRDLPGLHFIKELEKLHAEAGQSNPEQDPSVIESLLANSSVQSPQREVLFALLQEMKRNSVKID